MNAGARESIASLQIGHLSLMFSEQSSHKQTCPHGSRIIWKNNKILLISIQYVSSRVCKTPKFLHIYALRLFGPSIAC